MKTLKDILETMKDSVDWQLRVYDVNHLNDEKMCDYLLGVFQNLRDDTLDAMFILNNILKKDSNND
jgi:hypothetical protein